MELSSYTTDVKYIFSRYPIVYTGTFLLNFKINIPHQNPRKFSTFNTENFYCLGAFFDFFLSSVFNSFVYIEDDDLL